MVSSFLNESIMKRAQEKGAVEIEVINIRDFSEDNYKTVDDKPYGGGAGMVLMVEPVVKALRSIKSKVSSHSKVLLTSAKGKVHNQDNARELAYYDHIVILAGHYEGFDERILDYVDEEISIGNFVMTGGEIAAAAIVDSIVRLLPGVLKQETATTDETFFEAPVEQLLKLLPQEQLLTELKNKGVETVQLVEYPHYTRPEEFEGKKVPDILLSGHHKNIQEWRLKEAYNLTKQRRPDLLKPLQQ